MKKALGTQWGISSIFSVDGISFPCRDQRVTCHGQRVIYLSQSIVVSIVHWSVFYYTEIKINRHLSILSYTIQQLIITEQLVNISFNS